MTIGQAEGTPLGQQRLTGQRGEVDKWTEGQRRSRRSGDSEANTIDYCNTVTLRILFSHLSSVRFIQTAHLRLELGY